MMRENLQPQILMRQRLKSLPYGYAQKNGILLKHSILPTQA